MSNKHRAYLIQVREQLLGLLLGQINSHAQGMLKMLIRIGEELENRGGEEYNISKNEQKKILAGFMRRYKKHHTPTQDLRMQGESE